MRYTKYPELKAELKELAKEIKRLKYKRDHWMEFGNDQSEFMWQVQRDAWEFRHWHIAYCMLNGTEYSRIEQPREGNKPDMPYVKYIIKNHEQKAELRAV